MLRVFHPNIKINLKVIKTDIICGYYLQTFVCFEKIKSNFELFTTKLFNANSLSNITCFVSLVLKTNKIIVSFICRKHCQTFI